MIRDLSIANLGVIAETHIEFAPGLTVLTGETGAGKTLITTALSLLLGAKADSALVRPGATEAVVDCTLSVSASAPLRARLDEIGAVLEDDALIVTRSVGARSRALVGGRPVAAAVLAELLDDQVTVHGQHGQVRLMRPADQRSLLDASEPAISDLLPTVRRAWQNLRDARAEMASAQSASQEDSQALGRHQALLDDVESIAPQVGEDSALDARIATLSAAEAIDRASRTALAMLVDGDSIEITDVTTLMLQARRLLEPHASDATIAQWTVALSAAHDALSSLAHEIARFVDGLDGEAASLDELMARRAAIGALLRRWGCDLPTLLDRADEAGKALAMAADPQARLAELYALVQHCEQELDAVCARLHELRERAAGTLAARVQAELRELGLPHAEFDISVFRAFAPTASGDDQVEFRFTANPGQPAQALSKVASGGELSRVMLALETVAAGAAEHTFVFDEVDAGVGGRAALAVGARLAALARRNQVIVVTHLAQVAAFADRHIVVEKFVDSGTTSTAARALSHDERPRELTRLLSGVEDSSAAQAHAVELLELAASARGGAL